MSVHAGDSSLHSVQIVKKSGVVPFSVSIMNTVVNNSNNKNHIERHNLRFFYNLLTGL